MPTYCRYYWELAKAKVTVSSVQLSMDKRPKVEFCQVEGRKSWEKVIRERLRESWEPEGERDSCREPRE